MNKPNKWTEVYPHGTKEGDEEARFFKALARHPKYDWRSTGAIIKASKLSQERVEEIIDKYISLTPPLIFPHPKNDSHWGYWERVPEQLKSDNRDLFTKDKDSRIGKHLGIKSSTSIQVYDADPDDCVDDPSDCGDDCCDKIDVNGDDCCDKIDDENRPSTSLSLLDFLQPSTSLSLLDFLRNYQSKYDKHPTKEISQLMNGAEVVYCAKNKHWAVSEMQITEDTKTFLNPYAESVQLELDFGPYDNAPETKFDKELKGWILDV